MTVLYTWNSSDAQRPQSSSQNELEYYQPTPRSTYKQDSLQRPLQSVTFVMDHLLQTQDHNPNLATSLLVSCGTRQNSRYQTPGKLHQETKDGEGPRGQAQNTPQLQSRSLWNLQPSPTPFTAGVLRTQSKGGGPEQAFCGPQRLDKAIHSTSFTFLLGHQIQNLKCSFLRHWNLWLLATAWGVPNIFFWPHDGNSGRVTHGLKSVNSQRILAKSPLGSAFLASRGRDDNPSWPRPSKGLEDTGEPSPWASNHFFLSG